MSQPIVKVIIPGIPLKTKFGGIGYCSISLIKDGKDVILFDVGHYAVREKIIDTLKKYKINKVFISHLHYDHCLNIDLFVKKGIKIYLNEKEFLCLDKIKKEDVYTFKYFKNIVSSKNLVLFNGEFNISKNVSAIETIGHTSGHSSLIFKMKNKHCIVAGDAIKTYKDYKNITSFDVVPFSVSALIKTKKEIVYNFDIIIPGHSGAIINGKKPSEEAVFYEF
ncbi:MAG: MBL fold metallo-hydrolase [Candidatus Falkowbacteria bacterium]|nr:MBL fold metallo-hydrolase [Candidatus Falkowbacteria bacterium]